MSVDKPIYEQGDPIVVSFSNAPGTNPRDQIAVYTYGPDGADLPSPGGALLWSYIGGTQRPTTAPASGPIVWIVARTDSSSARTCFSSGATRIDTCNKHSLGPFDSKLLRDLRSQRLKREAEFSSIGLTVGVTIRVT